MSETTSAGVAAPFLRVILQDATRGLQLVSTSPRGYRVDTHSGLRLIDSRKFLSLKRARDYYNSGKEAAGAFAGIHAARQDLMPSKYRRYQK
jgi:hypothetical protein